MKKLLLFIFLIGVLGFRLWLATQAKHGDMYNNWSWGEMLVSRGPSGLYELPASVWSHSRPNQPPGSLYLHAASVVLYQSTNSLINYLNSHIGAFPSQLVWDWPITGPLISLKVFSILADFIIAYLLYLFSRLAHQVTWGKLVAFFYLLNPALWYNSSFWGQTDSVVAALGLAAFYLLLTKRHLLSVVFMAVCLITKLSWFPLSLLWGLLYFKTSFSKIGFILLIPVIWLLFSYPFHPDLLTLPTWLISLFQNRLLPGESAYITVNAFNFWSLFFPADRIPDTSLFLGLPANFVAYLILLPLILFSVIRLFTTKTVYPILVLLAFAFFLFAPRMHERYLYPVFPLFSVFIIFSKKHLLYLFLYLTLSILYLFNMYHAWFAPSSPFLQSLYSPQNIHLAAVAYLVAFLWVFRLQFTYAPQN